MKITPQQRSEISKQNWLNPMYRARQISSRLGKKHSEEHKRKISIAIIGDKNPFFGKKHSEETRRKIKEARSKQVISESTKNKLRGSNNVNFGIPRTEEVKAKSRAKMLGRYVGEKSPCWIKDRSLLKKQEDKRSTVYNEWRTHVKIRDEWKCRMANIDCIGNLEAHHILNYEDYPELRYDINNGITLCHAHHPRGRKKEAELSPYFQELVNKKIS